MSRHVKTILLPIYGANKGLSPDIFATNPFRTAVPFWGQTPQILSNLPPHRDCGPKRIDASIIAEHVWKHLHRKHFKHAPICDPCVCFRCAFPPPCSGGNLLRKKRHVSYTAAVVCGRSGAVLPKRTSPPYSLHLEGKKKRTEPYRRIRTRLTTAVPSGGQNYLELDWSVSKAGPETKNPHRTAPHDGKKKRSAPNGTSRAGITEKKKRSGLSLGPLKTRALLWVGVSGVRCGAVPCGAVWCSSSRIFRTAAHRLMLLLTIPYGAVPQHSWPF